MCGIAGISGAFPEGSTAAAMRGISHRGPDDRGEFADVGAGVWLGHSRLSILDLSPLGHQPMVAREPRVALVFNGEIYNFRELRSELETLGHRFASGSDTEVLLQLYLEHGEGMLRRLNGIFAFAVWDPRDGTLLIARDALGVKPLYYAATTKAVAFASEIKALLPLVPEVRDLDPVALHRYLSFLWCPGEGTPLKGVRKLLPGEAMVVHKGRVARKWSWYDLPVFRVAAAPMTPDVAIRGTARHLRRAVHRQLVADVPVGAFLSGGLDSSAVVSFAREEVPEIRCFTIETSGGQEAGMADDLPYARRVARHLGVPLDVVHIDAPRMASDIEMMIAQLDEPLADPAPLNVLYISRLARDNNMKVLLSGAGGDDLFTGYRRHVALRYERYWRGLPRGMRLALDRATAELDQRKPLFRRLSKLFNGAGLDGDARIANYFVWAREEELRELYSPAFRAALGSATATAPMLDFLAGAPVATEPLDRMLALEQRFFLPDHNLTYTDKMSMAAGVEVRVPFLDIELVEYAASIPVGLKQRGTEGKWVLKKAMEPYLPRDVIYRSKSGFGAPLRRWMRNELRPLLADTLSTSALEARGLFDPQAVHRLMADNDRGRVDAAYTLLSLLSIEIWCRTYLDAAPGAALQTCAEPGTHRRTNL